MPERETEGNSARTRRRTRTKAKPNANLMKKKDPNATFANVLKLMKDKIDKEQVTENVNKIRQTKTGDVLAQLQRGSNAKHLKEAVTTTIGSEVTVLQLSQQIALDVRDMDMDTTEGKVQKALAETAGVRSSRSDEGQGHAPHVWRHARW